MTNASTLLSDRRALLTGIGGIAAGALLVGARAEAGSLAPSAAPAPTGKPLREIEPRIAINVHNTPGDANSIYRIVQPGSYYLTSNLLGQVGKHGIKITTSNVSIDLMGFLLQGVPGSLNGITAEGVELRYFSIRNGSVVTWGQDGIRLVMMVSAGDNVASIEGIRAINNGFSGIRAPSRCILKQCLSMGNGVSGLDIGSHSVMESCLSGLDAGTGLALGGGSSISNCSTCFTSGLGAFAGEESSILNTTALSCENSGITAGPGTRINTCCARFNGGSGIGTSQGANVSNCSVQSNSQSGITIGDGVVVDCVAHANNLHGIEASQVILNVLVLRCLADGNNADGFRGYSDANIQDSLCTNNEGVGIGLEGTGNRVDGNSATRNRSKGIVGGGDSLFLRNTVVDNRNIQGVGEGLEVTGTNNRLEENHSVLNSPGFRATSQSVIVGNSVRVSVPNFAVGAGNGIGPTVTSATIGASTSSHANYEF